MTAPRTPDRAAPPGPRARPAARPAARWLAAALLALAGACFAADGTSPHTAQVQLSLALPGPTRAATIIPDSVVLTITGAGIGKPITTTVIPDTAGNATVTLQVPIGDNRLLQLDYFKGGTLVFSGSYTFTVAAGTNTPPPVTPTPINSPITLNVGIPPSVTFASPPDSAVLLISGPGITTPVRVSAPFNASGIASGSYNLPVGSPRAVVASFYTGGVLVFEGTASVVIIPGTNTPQSVVPTQTLSPIQLQVNIPGGIPQGLSVPDSAILTVTGLGVSPSVRGKATFNPSGVASTTLTIPVGAVRNLQVDMFQGGALVFSGTSTFGVTSGSNATQNLTPVAATGNVPITVTVGAYSISVTPPTATVAAGNTTTLTATVLDPTGAPTTAFPVAWATSNPAIATVSAAGVVTGVRSGTTTITATVLGQAATATITVP